MIPNEYLHVPFLSQKRPKRRGNAKRSKAIAVDTERGSKTLAWLYIPPVSVVLLLLLFVLLKTSLSALNFVVVALESSSRPPVRCSCFHDRSSVSLLHLHGATKDIRSGISNRPVEDAGMGDPRSEVSASSWFGEAKSAMWEFRRKAALLCVYFHCATLKVGPPLCLAHPVACRRSWSCEMSRDAGVAALKGDARMLHDPLWRVPL